tara:strand:+ start:10790 stop:11134 length:345 start_codon:yes stop_codon:yes gene_type:complete
MKKGPLSKKEKQFITENKNKEIEKIAEELSRSVAVVKKFHQTIKNENEEAQLPPKSGDLFARNKRYGVVTMTETASMAADESRKKNLQKKKEEKEEDNPLPPRYGQSIHRFRSE